MACKKAAKGGLLALALICMVLVSDVFSLQASASETEVFDGVFNQLSGSSTTLALVLEQVNVVEEDGYMIAYYEGDVTIPYIIYNNSNPGYLSGQLVRNFTFRISSVITGSSVRLYQPSIISSENPDGISTFYQFNNFGHENSGIVSLGVNVHDLYINDLPYSGYATLRLRAVTYTPSSSYYGESYRYVGVSLDITSDWYGANRYTPSLQAAPGSVLSGLQEGNTLIEEGNALQEEANQLQEEANQLQEEANETSRGILSKITDFFNGFFSNLGNTVLSWIVPSSEDLAAFLEEVNTWFSDRLGFLWYIFSLAVDIVAAFAGGTADTGFYVPALTLNILGEEYQIWGNLEVDIDAFGIFQYVRYFTSALLCGGVVKLALDKWDEWIGGHGVG